MQISFASSSLFITNFSMIHNHTYIYMNASVLDLRFIKYTLSYINVCTCRCACTLYIHISQLCSQACKFNCNARNLTKSNSSWVWKTKYKNVHIPCMPLIHSYIHMHTNIIHIKRRKAHFNLIKHSRTWENVNKNNFHFFPSTQQILFPYIFRFTLSQHLCEGEAW